MENIMIFKRDMVVPFRVTFYMKLEKCYVRYYAQKEMIEIIGRHHTFQFNVEDVVIIKMEDFLVDDNKL